MSYINGVNLIPGTGEFGYDTLPYEGRAATSAAPATLNLNYAPSGSKTDYSYSLDQLQAEFPDCTTVALVVSWFGNSVDLSTCQIYPSNNFINGSFRKLVGGSWEDDDWRCSGLTQNSDGIIPISMTGGGATYGGSPSDPSVVRCIEDLKARGFRVTFYPFILMDCTGLPWRGRISYSPDVSAAAAAAVTGFLGSAAPSQFTRDATNLTVAYAGASTDYTFRRMILHYANLCVIAGGVDLFLLGSELRGIETVRGPAWTKAGTTGGDGKVTWDYPFVNGLIALADDVRSIFDAAGLSKDTSALHNLVAYSADWSDWMGFQHPGEEGQWPHLDQLWGHSNIDLVAFDNYLPLSDWTSTGGLDQENWDAPPPSSAWPPSVIDMNGLGLSGPPMLANKAYLKANIEGGEKFNWFYNDDDNLGRGFDPAGSDQQLSVPAGDRLTQSRNPYAANQQLLANKQLRWWWNNPHQAIYDNGDGAGWSPHGAVTAWAPNSKPLTFAEYGFPSLDRSTNQPNVFFDPRSAESFTPYWSIWDPTPGPSYLPRRDDTLSLMALQAIYEYWVSDGHNETVGGVRLVEPAFMSVWNWDARPFPTFPLLSNVWGDAANWAAGNWLSGKGPYLPAPVPPGPIDPGAYDVFPALASIGWSLHQSPRFSIGEALSVSGRSKRAAKMVAPLWNFELAYEVLRPGAQFNELQRIVSFFEVRQGQGGSFFFEPPGLSPLVGQSLGIGDGATKTFTFQRTIGAYAETLAAVCNVAAVYEAGLPVPASLYTIGASGFPATLTFGVAPAEGAAISADFSYYVLCRFADDFEDVEEFMADLFKLQSLKLRSVKL